MPNNTATLSSIDLSVTYNSGLNSLEVGVFTDNSGSVGTLVESVTIAVTQTDFTVLTNASFSGVNQLTQGEVYWLGLAVPDGSDGNILWGSDFMSSNGFISETTGVGVAGLTSPWEPDNWNGNDPGYEVYGNVVPEPSTYALIIGCACLGFVVLKRRRQKTELIDQRLD